MSHENALQKALIAHLRADPAVQALLGGRIWDARPDRPNYPHLLIGRSESRPIGADGGGIEHLLNLTVASRFQGSEEARAIVAAVRRRLTDAALDADGVRTVSLMVRFTDVWPAPDRLKTFAVLRVRAVTEDI